MGSEGLVSGAVRLRLACRKALTVAYAVCMAASIGYLVHLNVSDWLAQREAERNITRIQNLYPDENDPERLEYKRQAQLYNAVLAGNAGGDAVGGANGDGVLPYKEQLFYKQEPMISYIEIPKIAVKLPIYHGTEDNALMAGVGHLEGSSLPIGGVPSRCVLLGHSGMPNTRMFDDLHKLEPGDVFVIWTLGDPYAYQVVEAETVLPDQLLDRLGLEPGCDLATLVTCTPYGVNSHRLLVHAERCAYDGASVGEVGVDAYLNARTGPLIAAMLLLLAVATVTIARILRRKASRNGRKKR